MDNRVRFYGVAQPVTAWERQRVSDFGGCTVTLIGPRHVLTAAHCVYNRSAGAGVDPGNGWGVTGVHIASVCSATASSPCSSSDLVRPLLATRITPEYSGVIRYFRNLYP